MPATRQQQQLTPAHSDACDQQLLIAAQSALSIVDCSRSRLVAVRTAPVAAGAAAVADAAAAGVAYADIKVSQELTEPTFYETRIVSEVVLVAQQTIWLGASASFRRYT
jgi:hypothetical protein